MKIHSACGMYDHIMPVKLGKTYTRLMPKSYGLFICSTQMFNMIPVYYVSFALFFAHFSLSLRLVAHSTHSWPKWLLVVIYCSCLYLFALHERMDLCIEPPSIQFHLFRPFSYVFSELNLSYIYSCSGSGLVYSVQHAPCSHKMFLFWCTACLTVHSLT